MKDPRGLQSSFMDNIAQDHKTAGVYGAYFYCRLKFEVQSVSLHFILYNFRPRLHGGYQLKDPRGLQSSFIDNIAQDHKTAGVYISQIFDDFSEKIKI